MYQQSDVRETEAGSNIYLHYVFDLWAHQCEGIKRKAL
jgi:hypothetical protein